MMGSFRQGRRWAPAIGLSLFMLTGCALVDQNTFAPAPEARPEAAAQAAPAPAVPVDNRRPLVTIDYTTPDPNYRQLLDYAVHAADARDHGVQYDVVAVVPTADAAEPGQHDAAGVMRAIMANGIEATRIHLGLRVDPGLAARQVRVYVR